MRPSSRRFLLTLVVAALAAVGGWFLGARSGAGRQLVSTDTGTTATPQPRRVLFYQSPMHPWIKSDKPGKCTICGMDLAPVYEGDPGFATSPDMITLSRSSIQVVGVETVEVRAQPLARTLRVAGIIEDDDTRHRVISAYVDGRVDRLFVNFVGADVVAGQPLALIYSPRLVAAQREYADTLARGTASRERLRLLGLVDSQIDALRPGVEPPTQTEILAPMSGTVVTREVNEGKYVKEGEPLFQIADYSRMWFVFDVYERDLDWLRTGMPVQVSVESRPGETFTAPIDFIDPTIESASRTAKVRVVLENPVIDPGPPARRALKHKLYAEARIALDAPVALAVPRRAVLDTGGRVVAYVDKGGGAYQQRELKLGRRGDTLVEVLSGLAAGERVVTEGNLILDGQAQLNSGLVAQGADAVVPATGGGAAEPVASMPTGSLEKVEELVSAAAAAAETLAADHFEPWHVTARRTQTAAAALQRDHAPEGFERVASLASPLPAAADLKAARAAFEPFSTALADWLRPVRAQNPATLTFRIYECRMSPVLGTGRWVQMDPPLRNPFFGSAMLECGDEVK